MNKAEFLERIKVKIISLPYGEMRRHLDYYDEMIDDRMEEGLSEEEAVASMESPETIAEQILREASPAEEVPESNTEPEKKKEKRYLYRLGFLPFVILLLIVAIAMIILTASLACCAVGFCIACAGALVKEGIYPALVMGGSALISLGVTFFLIPACKALCRAFGRSMRWACGKNSKEVSKS